MSGRVCGQHLIGEAITDMLSPESNILHIGKKTCSYAISSRQPVYSFIQSAVLCNEQEEIFDNKIILLHFPVL